MQAAESPCSAPWSRGALVLRAREDDHEGVAPEGEQALGHEAPVGQRHQYGVPVEEARGVRPVARTQRHAP